jgi:hypothetical protein
LSVIDATTVHISSDSDVLFDLADQHSLLQDSREASVLELDSHRSDPEPDVPAVYFLAYNRLRMPRFPDSGFQQYETQVQVQCVRLHLELRSVFSIRVL